jgi:hypothetical protein
MTKKELENIVKEQEKEILELRHEIESNNLEPLPPITIPKEITEINELNTAKFILKKSTNEIYVKLNNEYLVNDAVIKAIHNKMKAGVRPEIMEEK